MTQYNPEMKLQILPIEKLSEAAAYYVSEISEQSLASHGYFSVAFSGGSLPKLICPLLVAKPLCKQIRWEKWHVFWADERCVPPTSAYSNYNLLSNLLLDHVDIPRNQIYRPDTTLAPTKTAETYQATIQTILKPPQDSLPVFDLILLGIGEDGHTASLFPNHSLLKENERWVAPVFNSPKPPPERVTLTLPVINNARHIAFIATGKSKAKILRHIHSGKSPDYKIPATLVRPFQGELRWFIDTEAKEGIDMSQ